MFYWVIFEPRSPPVDLHAILLLSGLCKRANVCWLADRQTDRQTDWEFLLTVHHPSLHSCGCHGDRPLLATWVSTNIAAGEESTDCGSFITSTRFYFMKTRHFLLGGGRGGEEATTVLQTAELMRHWRQTSRLIWYDMIWYDMIWYDIFNCNWVATRWQLFSTHIHTQTIQGTSQNKHHIEQHKRNT
jgi:hypothetical protein